MSEQVEVPYGEDRADTAVLLLAAAEELGLGSSVVQTTSEGFRVPKEVNDKAFGSEKKSDAKKSASAKKK